MDTDETLLPFVEWFPDAALLFTTRSNGVGAGRMSHTIDVLGLARDASRVYVRQCFGGEDTRLDDIDEILAHVEDHPLAVKILAETLRATASLTPKEALRLLRASSHTGRRRGAKRLLVHVPESLQDCFWLSIHRLPHGPLRPFLIAAASQSPLSWPIVAADYVSGVGDVPKSLEVAKTLCSLGLVEELPEARFRVHRVLRDYLRAAHGKEGFGFLPPTWEIASLAPILMFVAKDVSAGTTTYDHRQESWFLRYARSREGDVEALQREWDGLAAGIFRRLDAGAPERARARLAELKTLLRGANLAGMRLDRVMLEGANFENAHLERVNLSGAAPRRWPEYDELISALRALATDALTVFITTWVLYALMWTAWALVFRKTETFADVMELSLAVTVLDSLTALVVAEHLVGLFLLGGHRLDRCASPSERTKTAERFFDGVYPAVLYTGILAVIVPMLLCANIMDSQHHWTDQIGSTGALLIVVLVVALPFVAISHFWASRVWSSLSTFRARMSQSMAGGMRRRFLCGLAVMGRRLYPLLFIAGIGLLGAVVGLFGADSSTVVKHTTELVSFFFALFLLTMPTMVYGITRDPELVGMSLYSVRTSYLRGARLRQCNLRRAILRWVRLEDADLTEADLAGADLGDAALLRARLVGANLSDSRLAGADLTGADLRGARLIGADLSGAKLAEVDLTEAVHGPTTRWPDGFNPAMHSAGGRRSLATSAGVGSTASGGAAARPRRARDAVIPVLVGLAVVILVTVLKLLYGRQGVP